MRNKWLVAFSTGALIVLFVGAVSAQTTAFTYQGSLKDGANAASGTYDFEFALYDSGGAQLGGTLTQNSIAVANGIFSVLLDFGNQFSGAGRLLEIRVRLSGGGGFTTLSPRQPVNSSPYSVKSVTADSATNAVNATTAINATNAVNATSATNAANFSGPLSGDVTGTQGATTVARLQGRIVANTAPTGGQVLKFNSGTNQWTPDTDLTGGAGGGGTITGVTAGTGLTGGGVSGTVTVNIAPGGIGSTELATNSVTTSKIVDANVTDAKIANVAGGKITGSITTATLPGANVTSPVANATNATTAAGFSGPLAGDVTGTQNATILANNAVTTTKIADSAITSAKIATGQVVKNVNGLTDNITLAAGTNITITPAGNTLTIASTGGGNAILNQTTAQAGANFNISGSGTIGGTINLPTTTDSGVGVIRQNGNPLIHTFGTDNFFAGKFAGNFTTTGFNNSFVGSGAGKFTTAGIANSFFGTDAGLQNTTGESNSFFGHNAGRLSTIGFSNSFFGKTAGFFNTTGFYNSFFGDAAGLNNTIGSSNTIVGTLADVGSGALTNATAIGAFALVSQSDSLILGSINGVNTATADTKVGIGTTTPSATLTVSASTTSALDNTATFKAPNIGGNQSHIHYGSTGDWYIRSAAGAGKVIIQDSGGNVGIGTAAPDSRLTVNGTASKPGGGSWAVFSDERLKNIGKRFTPGLKALMQLQPLSYQYRTDNALGIKMEGDHIGFSAQSVERIIPEAVTKNDQGYRLVNNDPIMWTMLNAIKEQQSQIEAQQKQIAKLFDVNASLNGRVRVVEKHLRKLRGSSAARR